MSARARYERAFVTGASSGLGRGIALELARRGARVVLAARREAELAGLAAEIERAGGRADLVPLDVRDTQAVRAAVERWDREVGGFDLVLANAGIAGAGEAGPREAGTGEASTGEASARQASARGDRSGALESAVALQVLQVNVLGAVATLCAALPAMRARGRGTLAGVSSLAALRGMPGNGAYSASKAALSTFLESLAADLAGSGVRVVDIQPGYVRTPMTAANRFAMPFLVELEPAVQKCVDGLERRRALVHFPWALSWPLRALVRPLPRPVWLALARRLRREG